MTRNRQAAAWGTFTHATLDKTVILSRAFRRRISRDISDLIAASMALPPETLQHGPESHAEGIQDCNISAGPSPKDTAQDDRPRRAHGYGMNRNSLFLAASP